MKYFKYGSPAPIAYADFMAKNKVPPVEKLNICHESIVPDMMNVWYEYIPASYDGKTPLPLIVQLHGGGMDGRRWADMTLWHVLAERKGLIVIYPNSPDYGTWRCDDRDVEFLYRLIKLVCEKYNIDKTRIYMQGMSNGDMMTLAFTMQHPEILAAAGYSTGPSAHMYVDDERPVGALPAIQMRGELDLLSQQTEAEPLDKYEIRYNINDFNRELWQDVNGLDELPLLTLRGKDNFMRFKGETADLINWEIVGCGHREPADMAQVYWDTLYSGYSRVDGQLVRRDFEDPLTPDEDLVAIALGSRNAFVGNKVVQMTVLDSGVVRLLDPTMSMYKKVVDPNEMMETPALFAPVEFFVAAFGAKLSYLDSGDCAVVEFPDGNVAIFRSDSLLVEYNGRFRSMRKPSVLLGGNFYIPVGEFCADFMNMFVSQAADVMLISGHSAILGRYTARVLRRILGGYVRAIE